MPVYQDGTHGLGFRCKDGNATWQIEKLYLRDG